MRILIIKTSSLGDVIHTLPAVTDAYNHIKNIHIDWILEPAFAEIPRFHPAVNNIILSPLRQWRKEIIKGFKTGAYRKFYQQIQQAKYDYIIDAQGLIKSALLMLIARGEYKCGYDSYSITERLSCLAYNHKFSVSRDLHAITRIRKLFGCALKYDLPDTFPDYNIQLNFEKSLLLKFLNISSIDNLENYMIFFHGTTREDKRWPIAHWEALIKLCTDHNKNRLVLLPWGNAYEKETAEKLAVYNPQVRVLPYLSLSQLANLIFHSQLNISVDTGLGHLCAALGKRTISLYGPTDPELIGSRGKNQAHLKAGSMKEILPAEIFSLIQKNNFI